MNTIWIKIQISRFWRTYRGFMYRLGSMIFLHELLVLLLCGRDVTAVLLAPNANTPIHWALLALLLLGLRFLLFIVAPARFVWLLTKSPEIPLVPRDLH